MRELSLFTGAGGGLLGTHLLGWKPCGYVEWNEYCQQVIAARIRDGYLPAAPIFTDVREFVQSGAAEQYQGIADVVTAGFPCQPFTVAGKQLAGDDERNMWPATSEVIRAVQPKHVLLENVRGLISCGYIGTVIGDLADLGYVGKWGVIGADNAEAPHERKRLWIVAHADSERFQNTSRRSQVAKQSRNRSSGRRNWWHADPSERRGSVEPSMGRVANGLAFGMDRLAALGNGQVPAVVESAWNLLT
jgi:DNA (cytosine-5)-methyltransferase 1